MAIITANFFPLSLGFDTRIEVLMPQDPRHYQDSYAPIEKIVYLLHGSGGDSAYWMRETRVAVYAAQHRYMVVMPEVQRSCYCDMKHGSAYFTYITQELPKIVEQLFNFKHIREKTFIAGLSMGGYGAMKCGLGRPDFYGACASFAGAVDIAGDILSKGESDGIYTTLQSIWGTDLIIPPEDDIFALAKETAKLPREKKPRVLLTCGDKDFLLKGNRKFNAFMQTLPIDYEYKEWSGSHDWLFWEQCLPIMFDFFNQTQEGIQ